MTTRSWTPDLGIEMLWLSTLIGYFSGSELEKNRLINNRIISFVFWVNKRTTLVLGQSLVGQIT